MCDHTYKMRPRRRRTHTRYLQQNPLPRHRDRHRRRQRHCAGKGSAARKDMRALRGFRCGQIHADKPYVRRAEPENRRAFGADIPRKEHHPHNKAFPAGRRHLPCRHTRIHRAGYHAICRYPPRGAFRALPGICTLFRRLPIPGLHPHQGNRVRDTRFRKKRYHFGIAL